jgi:glycosyltransferase involved in cell wall biosynthesis
MHQPRVSVVTPFYNTEAYLAECIESVLAQRYDNFEYILVNNRSTDASRDIALKYTALDSRLRLVDNEVLLNQVQNYNHALRQLSPDSRFCKVVQADDWILPDCLARMVAVADSDPSVAIVGAYGQIEERVHFYGLPLGASVFSGKDVCRRFWADGLYVFGSPTCVLYRSDLIRSRRDFYDASTPLEDADVCFELLKDRNFGFVHQVLTFTRRQHGSLLTGIALYDYPPLLKLMTILRYGNASLDPADMSRLRRSVTQEYLRSVGASLVKGVGFSKGFRRFHRQGRACCSFEPSWARVLGYAAIAALDLLLNPKSTAEAIWRRWRPRTSTDVTVNSSERTH